ncbi:MAG: membrane or secreted protein [Actinobacteria bacterium]|nr:MAG: membrane or secreted protein [Actinomycetota bacterium]
MDGSAGGQLGRGAVARPAGAVVLAVAGGVLVLVAVGALVLVLVLGLVAVLRLVVGGCGGGRRARARAGATA